jgi:hypothetical protein
MSSSGSATGESFACGSAIQATTYTYEYNQGSIVYSIAKAKKGILEAIVIKSVRLFINQKTFGQTKVMYYDTFNGLWGQEELCTQATAKAFAIEYLENLQLELQTELENCH